MKQLTVIALALATFALSHPQFAQESSTLKERVASPFPAFQKQAIREISAEADVLNGVASELAHQLIYGQDRELRLAAGEGLLAIGPSAHHQIGSIKRGLKHQDVGVRRLIVLVIGNCGALAWRAVPDLIATLNDEDNEVRGNVVRALGNIGPRAKEAIPSLKKLAPSQDKVLTRAVEAALRAIETEK